MKGECKHTFIGQNGWTGEITCKTCKTTIAIFNQNNEIEYLVKLNNK